MGGNVDVFHTFINQFCIREFEYWFKTKQTHPFVLIQICKIQFKEYLLPLSGCNDHPFPEQFELGAIDLNVWKRYFIFNILWICIHILFIKNIFL